MPVNYEARIKTKASADLVSMLDDLQAGKTLAGWAPGKAFEYIILREFEIEGARVVWPYSVLLQKKQIEQIDGAVYHEHLCCLVEAKDRDGTEGIEPIAKLRNQLIRRPAATIGLVFTTSQFSEPAKLLTRMMNPLSILMWEFGELRDAVGKAQICRALQTKFMYAVEWGMPDYDTRKGIR